MTDQGSTHRAASPWYVMLMFGVGGWVAGLLLAGFVFTLAETLVSDGERATFVIVGGAVMLIAALLLVRRFTRPFARQFLNAAAIGGHAAILIDVNDVALVRVMRRALDGVISEFSLVVAISVAIVVIFYALYPDRVHRFITALWAAGLLTTYAMFEFENYQNAVHAVFLLEGVLIIGLFGGARPTGKWRPLAFAAAFAGLLTPMLVLASSVFETLVWWPMHVVGAGLLMALIGYLRRDDAALTGPFLVVMIVLALAVGGLTTPGLTVALAILLLGYRHDEIVLRVAGICFVPVYMIVYYYDLDIDLLSKSLLLMAGGLAFIVARKVLDMVVRQPTRSEAGAQ